MNRLHKDWNCELICHERMNFLCHSLLDSETKLGEADRLNEMQCSFAANRVDLEDQQTATSGYTLPVFTDKIWAVALKAHGATFGDVQDINKPCPDILPLGCCILCHRVQLHGHKLQ